MTDIPHGTINGYNNHRCRCEPCSHARRLYAAKATARTLQRLHAYPDSPKHGTAYAYRIGCRCQPCRTASSNERRARRGAYKSKTRQDRR